MSKVQIKAVGKQKSTPEIVGLKIFLEKAERLPTSSNPFVLFRCGNVHAESSIQKKTESPVFKEYFFLQVSNVNDPLIIEVWDKSTSFFRSSKIIGVCQVNLGKIYQGETLFYNLKLENVIEYYSKQYFFVFSCLDSN